MAIAFQKITNPGSAQDTQLELLDNVSNLAGMPEYYKQARYLYPLSTITPVNFDTGLIVGDSNSPTESSLGALYFGRLSISMTCRVDSEGIFEFCLIRAGSVIHNFVLPQSIHNEFESGFFNQNFSYDGFFDGWFFTVPNGACYVSFHGVRIGGTGNYQGVEPPVYVPPVSFKLNLAANINYGTGVSGSIKFKLDGLAIVNATSTNSYNLNQYDFTESSVVEIDLSGFSGNKINVDYFKAGVRQGGVEHILHAGQSKVINISTFLRQGIDHINISAIGDSYSIDVDDFSVFISTFADGFDNAAIVAYNHDTDQTYIHHQLSPGYNVVPPFTVTDRLSVRVDVQRTAAPPASFEYYATHIFTSAWKSFDDFVHNRSLQYGGYSNDAGVLWLNDLIREKDIKHVSCTLEDTDNPMPGNVEIITDQSMNYSLLGFGFEPDVEISDAGLVYPGHDGDDLYRFNECYMPVSMLITPEGSQYINVFKNGVLVGDKVSEYVYLFDPYQNDVLKVMGFDY